MSHVQEKKGNYTCAQKSTKASKMLRGTQSRQVKTGLEISTLHWGDDDAEKKKSVLMFWAKRNALKTERALIFHYLSNQILSRVTFLFIISLSSDSKIDQR